VTFQELASLARDLGKVEDHDPNDHDLRPFSPLIRGRMVSVATDHGRIKVRLTALGKARLASARTLLGYSHAPTPSNADSDDSNPPIVSYKVRPKSV